MEGRQNVWYTIHMKNLEDRAEHLVHDTAKEAKEVKPIFSLLDVEAYTGHSIDTLAAKTVENILNTVRSEPDLESYYRTKYNIDVGMSIEAGLRAYAINVIHQYKTELPIKMAQYAAQIEYCISYAKMHQYTTLPNPFSVIITDEFLGQGATPELPCDEYDYRTRTVFIGIDRPNMLLAHEVGHALSHTADTIGTTNVGLRTIVKNMNDEAEYMGPQWLDEGATIVWEEATVNDGSHIPQRTEEHDIYAHFKSVTLLLLETINISSDLLLKAYFGDTEVKQYIFHSLETQFNCQMTDLDCLCLELDTSWARAVIYGEKVQVEVYDTDPETILSKKQTLARIFPNVQLVKVNM